MRGFVSEYFFVSDFLLQATLCEYMYRLGGLHVVFLYTKSVITFISWERCISLACRRFVLDKMRYLDIIEVSQQLYSPLTVQTLL